MNMVRCPVCKKKYQFNGLPPQYCPECYLKEEEQYQRVRALVKERPGISILEASEITGVPHTKILRYLREERLETMPGSTQFLHCVICGKVVNTGYKCQECKRRYGDSAPSEPNVERDASFDKKVYNVENRIDEPNDDPFAYYTNK